MIRGQNPVREGHIDRDGVRIHFQEFGAGDETIVLLPTWSIVHSDFWRRQIPELAARFRVIAFDGRGNGASDRPADPAAYSDEVFADDTLAVLDHLQVETAVVASVSAGAGWGLLVAAQHPERVSGAIFIGPSLPLGQPLPERAAVLPQFDTPQPSYEGWQKFNRHYWLQEWPQFLQFFFSKCFTEHDSDDEIAHFLAMGLETTPETILATLDAPGLDREQAEELARAVRCPTLVIHGDDDAISSITRGEELARLTSGRFIVMPGAGHEPQSRWPELVNPMILELMATVGDAHT